MLFKGEFPILGATTQVQELSGYSGAGAGYTVALNAYKPGTREILTVPLIVAAAASSQYIYQAPFTSQVVGIHVNWTVQSTGAATLSVERIIGDTVAPAAANGTTIILMSASTISLQGTANTRQNIALSTASGLPLVLNPGDQLAIFESAATTGLAGAYVQVEVVQIG